MSNEEFETYLALVSRLLRLSPNQREQIGEELRDHLESRVSELVEAGVKRQSAVLQAVEEFGDATVMAQNLKAVSLANRKRWMMRFMAMCTVAMFFLGVLTMAMWPQGARFGTPAATVAQDDDPFGDPAPVANNEAKDVQLSNSTQEKNSIRELLKQKSDLNFEEEACADVLAYLQDKLQTNIVLDSSAYEDSLEEDTLITTSLKQIRMSDGLRLMLRPHNATYFVDAGVIRIISIDDEPSPEFFDRRMIRVESLLDKIELKDKRVGTPRYSVGGGGGGGVFNLPSSMIPAQGLSRANDESKVAGDGSPQTFVLYSAESLLIEAIQETVEADAWIDTGQGECAITCVGGVLIVHAHEGLISQVEDFVVDLESELTQR